MTGVASWSSEHENTTAPPAGTPYVCRPYYLMAQLDVTQATPSISVTGGTFVYDGQPLPATGSVIGVNSTDLGEPTFAYSYTDAEGNVLILSGAPDEPGVFEVEASDSGSQNY